jgi:hypothetical protein
LVRRAAGYRWRMERDELERVDAEMANAEARMARDVEDLEARTERVAGHAEEARRDWERKREDPQVPGAPPREERQRPARDAAGDWRGEGPDAARAGQ